MLSVPKGASSGKVLRLKGKGFTAKNGQRGDQLVTLMVEVPDDPELAPLPRRLERPGQDEPQSQPRRLGQGPAFGGGGGRDGLAFVVRQGVRRER